MSEDRAQGFANLGVELLQPVALSKRYAITNVDELGVIERFRFVDVAHEVAHWAQLLREEGLQPGERVVVLAGREWQWRCALLGVLYAGGTAVACRASATAAEIEAISTDAKASLLISIRPRQSLLEGGPAVLSADELFALDAAHALDRPAHRSLPEDEALVLYSATATGLRGVVHTHASLISQAAAGEHWLGVGEEERVLSTAEDGSGASIWVLLAAWRNRANVVSVDLEPEPDAQLELLDRLRPTAVWFSDDEYGMLASATAPPWVDLSSIRRALISDETSAGATAFAQAFGAGLAPVFERNELGVIAGWPPGAEHEAVAETGVPVPGVQLVIVDEHGAQLPPSQVGNVMVGADSPSLFSGYTGGDKGRVPNSWLDLGWQGALSADGTLRVVSRSVETELLEAELDPPVARSVETSPEVALVEPERPSRRGKREAKRAQRREAREAKKRNKAEAHASGETAARSEREASEAEARRRAEEAEREAAEAAERRRAEAEEEARRQADEEAEQRRRAEAAALAERETSEAEARRRTEEAERAEREAAETEAQRHAEAEDQARREADEEAEEHRRAEAAALAEREAEDRRRTEDEKNRERKRDDMDRKAQRQAKREAREREKEEAARAKREAAEAEERRRREEKEAKERAKEEAARAKREAAEAKEREKQDAARAKREAAEAEERRRREEKEAREREKAEAAARAEREAAEQRQAKEAARAERRAARQRRGRRQRREEKEERRRAEQEAKEREKAETAARAEREAEERRRAEEEARAEKERERKRQREEKEAARAQQKAARATRFRRTKESTSVAAEDAEPERLNTEIVARIKQYGMAGSQPEPDEPPEAEAVNPKPTPEPTEGAD